MKAKEVIITGRKRSRAPSVAASKSYPFFPLLLRKFDDQDPVLRRETNQHNHADLPIEVEREAGNNYRDK